MSDQKPNDAGAASQADILNRAQIRRENDERLVAAVKVGDAETFGRLFDDWVDPVHDRLVRQNLTDGEVVEAEGKVFQAAWRELSRGRIGGSFGAGVMRSSLREAQAKRKPTAGGTGAEERLTRATNLEATVADVAVAALLFEAAEALGQKAREVLDLHFRHGLTAPEIGEVLGTGDADVDALIRKLPAAYEAVVRSRILWAGGSPDDEDLAAALAAEGVTEWGPGAVRVITREVKASDKLRSRSMIPLGALALFRSVPLAAPDKARKEQIAAALVGAGVPLGRSEVSIKAARSGGLSAAAVAAAAEALSKEQAKDAGAATTPAPVKDEPAPVEPEVEEPVAEEPVADAGADDDGGPGGAVLAAGAGLAAGAALAAGADAAGAETAADESTAAEGAAPDEDAPPDDTGADDTGADEAGADATDADASGDATMEMAAVGAGAGSASALDDGAAGEGGEGDTADDGGTPAVAAGAALGAAGAAGAAAGKAKTTASTGPVPGPTPEPEEGGGARKGLVAAAIVVAVLIVGGIAFALTSGGDDEQDVAAGGSTTTVKRSTTTTEDDATTTTTVASTTTSAGETTTTTAAPASTSTTTGGGPTPSTPVTTAAPVTTVTTFAPITVPTTLPPPVVQYNFGILGETSIRTGYDMQDANSPKLVWNPLVPGYTFTVEVSGPQGVISTTSPGEQRLCPGTTDGTICNAPPGTYEYFEKVVPAGWSPDLFPPQKVTLIITAT